MQQYDQDPFVLHNNNKKGTKGIKNVINAVDGQGLANNYNPETDQFQKYLCHAQIK